MENYPDKIILLDSIIDNLEINIIIGIKSNNANNIAKIKFNTSSENTENKCIIDRLINNINKFHAEINLNVNFQIKKIILGYLMVVFQILLLIK